MAEDIVERLKSTVRIEDVIEQDGYHLLKRGRYWPCDKHDSLIVDTGNQCYFWNSKSERGDVFNWLQTQHGWDFKTAVEDLCKRAGFSAPDWGKQDNQVRLVVRAREECFDVASRVFEKWLAGASKALEYCKGRGWFPETWQRHHLGYSGSGTPEERKEMIGELSLAGVDLKSPAAIAILGMKGGVEKWAKDRDVDLSNFPDWLKGDYIPGLIGHEGIIYTHVTGGKIKYFSRRAIAEKFHYNLPEPLVGKRVPFLNSAYSAAAEKVVVVEGPADAMSLAQWGIAAVAQQGLYQDQGFVDYVLRRQGKKKENDLESDIHVYIGVDGDEAGKKASWGNAEKYGPMVRIIHWPDVKDANDLLKKLIGEGADHKQQTDGVMGLINDSLTYVEEYCSHVGKQAGADRDKGLKKAYQLIASMPNLERGTYQKNLSERLKVSQQDYRRGIKDIMGEKKDEKKTRDATPTLGGIFGDWLVELMYDPEDDSTSLAWRDPEGNLGSGKSVDINGTVYEALAPNEAMVKGVIAFPSKVGDSLTTGEIVKYIELYIRKNYLLDRDLDIKIMSYYPLITWMYQSFNAIPYLRAMGAAGAGKSELMRRLGMLCYRTINSSGCDTPAVLFRTIERYHGTLMIDEADLEDSSTANPIVKLMNLGAMKGNYIGREREVTLEDGSKDRVEEYFDSFSPKLIAMRSDYKDDAVGTRCLTFKVDSASTRDLVNNDVPLEIDDDMRARALAIRNILLRWKLEHWQREIKINKIYYDLDISPRLNQVTGPLMAIARDDPELQKEIRQFLRDYYNELVQTKSMTMYARVIEALWTIYKFPDQHSQHVSKEADGRERIQIGTVTAMANQIADNMNAGDSWRTGEDEGKGKSKKKNDELTSRGVGQILRETLHLKISNRTKTGFYVYWDQDKIIDLSRQYGIDPAEIGPDNPGSKVTIADQEKAPAKASQPALPV